MKALESGVMKQQGAALSPAERLVVAQWLGRKTDIAIDPSRLTSSCKNPGVHDVSKRLPSWASWGGGLANLRFQTTQAAGLTGTEAQHLKLKWAFAVPDATSIRSQPAVYEGRVLFGGEGALYSLDAATGCTYWATETPAPVRSGISIGSPADTALAFFGDAAGNVHAVNAVTGAPVWQTRADAHPSAMVTGTPVYYEERLYVPVSSFEELAAVAAGYVCCTFRGSILALDARTGKLLWQTFTIDEVAKARHLTKSGTKTNGPSGAGIWSAPTIDSDKRVLYVTTGDNYSDPPSDKSDAVMALSIETGKLLWFKQLQAGDAFNVTCMNPDNKNCPDANGPDFDFGSSAILMKLPSGRRVLILSQKSGTVYGLDPDDRGKLVWRSQIGKGGVLGGIEWGPASDGKRLYVALSDEAFLPPAKPTDPPSIDPEKGGGLFALRLDNGERIWMTSPPPCDIRRPCSPGQPGAITAIPGAVFSGSLDGHIRGYSTVDGKIFWDYDTAHEYSTVNSVSGHGGSLNVAGPVIAGGTLYTISGYGQFGGAPGNVLPSVYSGWPLVKSSS
jgi:polyvinyl alcohol dehydrogenase (cytochrome)